MQPLFDVNTDNTDSLVSIADIARLLFKHKGTISLIFIIVTLIVGLSLFSLPPVYNASGKILVKTEQQGKPTFFSGVTSYTEEKQSDPVNRKMETEMQLVTTRTIAEQAVSELDIKYDQVFHKPLDHLLEPIGNAIDYILAIFKIYPDPENKGFNDTTEAFVKSIDVQPVRSKSAETSSNIMQLEIKTHDQDLAKNGLQKIMELYAQYDVTLSEQAGIRAKRIIVQRMQQASADMQAVQKEIETFLSANSGAEELRDNRRKQSILFSSPNDVASIVTLRQKIIDKELELDEVRQNYSSGNTRTKILQRTIRKLEQRINNEMQQFAVNDSKLSNLERRLAIAEEVFKELTKKISQIDLYLDMNELQKENRIIIESPIRPRESGWKKRVFLGVLGSIMGFILGIGLAGLREYLDTRLETEKTLRRNGLNTIGVIPELSEETLENSIKLLKSGRIS